MVDVASAHEHDLVDHLLVSDGVARCEVDLLTVHALQLHRHVVDVIVAACQSELIVLGLGVAYLHLSHAEISREGLDHLAFLVEQLAHKHIAVRSLAAPQLGRHVDVESCISCFACSHLYLFCLCLQRFARYLVRPQLALLDSICDGQVFCLLFGEVVEISLYLDGCLVRIVDARCAHDDILDLHLALGIQIDRAIDTWQTPHVLSLQETAIAVAIHLHGECVAALWVEVRSDVEACSVARILRESYILSVDPEVEERVDTIEIEVYLLVLPIGRHGELAAIRTHFVSVLEGGPVLTRFAHYATFPVIYSHRVLEYHRLVAVYRHAILQRSVFLYALYVPASWHRQVIPS